MSKEKDHHAEAISIKATLLGLGGVSLALLLHVLGKSPTLDTPLTIALYCFVTSIPLLAGFAIGIEVVSDQLDAMTSDKGMFLAMAQWVGAYVAVGGIVAFLWHFSVGAALAFIVASIVALFMFLAFTGVIGATPSPPGDNQKPSGGDAA